MNRVVLENELSQKLTSGGLRAEICDPTGHVLGYFHPVAARSVSPELLKWANDQVSDAELNRRLADKSGVSTEELLRHLDSI